MIDLKKQLLPDIRNYVIGVPSYVIERAIVDGCRRFFNESLMWEEKQTIDAYDNDVVIFPVDEEATTICDVASVVNQDGMKIHATWYSGKLQFDKAPNTKVCVTISLANNKANNKADVPDWAYNQHCEAITNAAVKSIKSQQFKPWFDPEGVKFHEMEYQRGLSDALLDRAPTRVKMNPLA